MNLSQSKAKKCPGSCDNMSSPTRALQDLRAPWPEFPMLHSFPSVAMAHPFDTEEKKGMINDEQRS